MRIALILTLIFSTAFAQSQTIKGIVKDEQGTPLKGATVSILKASDSSTIKLAVTNSTGVYIFSSIPAGNYRVMASYVGMSPVYSSLVTVTSENIDLPSFTLIKTSGNLGNVTVTARKPMVEVKADKMILNVEGTINSTGSNALELLRKSPGVLLDKDDNISFSGKNGVQVYIDGRTTPLSGQDLAQYLKSLQSSQIEAIELITNPSAKYEAAGNAGIINIRLVKNKALGTNGSVNAGWNQGKTGKYNGGLSINHRNKNVNLFSNYSLSYPTNEQNISIKRTVLDSVFDQHGRIMDKRSSHNYKIGADYFINKKNTVGIMINGVISDLRSNTVSKTNISNQANGDLNRILQADGETRLKRKNTSVNLNYSYVDPKGKNITVNADHGSYDLNSDQLQGNHYFDGTEQTNLDNIVYHMMTPASINISSVKADYEMNIAKGKLSVGGKTAWIKSDNDFQRFNVFPAGEQKDNDRSNHFIYKENINALYLNYNRQFKSFMFQAGFRVENTEADGISLGMKNNGSSYVENLTGFNRSYTDLFPSAAFTFNKNPMKQWSLTYSRRIDRPAYQDLNPFEYKMDEYTFMKGNINLRPQYTNSFGLTHTYKYKLNIALNYSHVNDMFAQILDTLEKTKTFISKKNLATQDIVSLNISYPYQYKSYTLFTNISSNYSKFKADFGEGRKIDLDAVGFNIFMQNSIKFAKVLTAELSGFYNAPTVYMGNFKGKSIYSLDAGLSKQCLDGRVTLKASVSDVFNTMKFRAESVFAGQLTNFAFKQETRQFKLNMTFRFGKNTVKPARQRTTGAEEEAKRVQQGGGVIGN